MSGPTRPVPDETARLQARASDPGIRSGCRPMPAPARPMCWPSASSGCCCGHRPVEHPLPDLYARRRRQHVEPRVLEPVRMDDARRRRAGRSRSPRSRARAPDAARLRAARRLFAEALETPGGLKIQTIHAFCEAVLHQFPLEANIAAHFEMLDPRMEQALFADGAPRNDDGRGRRRNPELGRGLRHGAGARRRGRARRCCSGDRAPARRPARLHRRGPGRRAGPLRRSSTSSASRPARPPSRSPAPSGRCRAFRRDISSDLVAAGRGYDAASRAQQHAAACRHSRLSPRPIPASVCTLLRRRS